MYVCVCVWIRARGVPLCVGEATKTSKRGWDSLFTENSFQKVIKLISKRKKRQNKREETSHYTL